MILKSNYDVKEISLVKNVQMAYRHKTTNLNMLICIIILIYNHTFLLNKSHNFAIIERGRTEKKKTMTVQWGVKKKE